LVERDIHIALDGSQFFKLFRLADIKEEYVFLLEQLFQLVRREFLLLFGRLVLASREAPASE